MEPIYPIKDVYLKSTYSLQSTFPEKHPELQGWIVSQVVNNKQSL